MYLLKCLRLALIFKSVPEDCMEIAPGHRINYRSQFHSVRDRKWNEALHVHGWHGVNPIETSTIDFRNLSASSQSVINRPSGKFVKLN
jgi:hypothetical protein